MLREINTELKNYQSGYNWQNSIKALSEIDISDTSWKLKLIIEILRMSNYFKFSALLESRPRLQVSDIEKMFAKCKSYYWNPKIIEWQLKQIIEWLTFYFEKKEYNYSLIWDIVTWRSTIEEFLWETKVTDTYNSKYLFEWKSWEIYEWTWVIQLRSLNEVKCLDILEWYKWSNKRLLSVIPYLLNKNNRDELKKEFKSFRWAILSALSEAIRPEEEQLDLDKQSKAINYILAKQSTETKETSWSAPF